MATKHKPHFFKVILDDSLRDGKVGIPGKFAEKYRGSLSSSVSLRDPCGALWPVDLSGLNGKLWLDKGWRQFSDHYSLQVGHFMIFKYRGKSLFNIFIFDKSSVEIEYPPLCPSPHCHDDNEASETDACEVTPCLKKKGKTSLSKTQPRRTTKKETESSNGVCEKEQDGFGELKHLQPKFAKRIRKLAVDQKTWAVKKAVKEFKSENPIFILDMQPTYVINPKQICVPLPFAEKFFPGNEGSVTLTVAEGRTWSAKYKIYIEKRRCQLSCGWRKFVWGNRLQMYDACVFELIGCSTLTLKVTIFRAAEYQIKPGEAEPVIQSPPSVLEVARSFESNYPFFYVRFWPTYAKGYLSIPRWFGKQYLQTALESVKLQVGEKLWPVNLLRQRGPFYLLSAGWTAFASENNLQLGNVCIFEMIKSDPIVLRTSILAEPTK